MKTIGIIGAMREEIAPILSALKCEFNTIESGNNTYYTIEYNGYNLIIAYSKIGKVHSTITCTTMILRFNVDCIIFTGVAGSLSSDIKVGDLVLATSLCQYDVDITSFGHPLGFIPDSAIYFDTSCVLNDLARCVAKTNNLDLKEGIIASGDTFISDTQKKQWIVNNFNAIAVEMEGASIAVSASAFNIPFCVIRSISDDASGDACISFDDFLLESASRSASFVLSMIDIFPR